MLPYGVDKLQLIELIFAVFIAIKFGDLWLQKYMLSIFHNTYVHNIYVHI